MATIFTQVGQPAGGLAGPGVTPQLRSGKQADLIMSQLHGRYYEQAANGNLFVIANQAAVATTAALTTTWTGLLIGNPTTQTTKNVSVLGFGYVQTAAASAATSIGLMTGTGASVTASLTPRNCLVGGAAPATLSNAGQTLPGTPVLERVFGSVGTLATSGYGTQPMTYFPVEGSIVLPAGAFCANYSTAANTAAWIFFFLFEEVAIS